MFFWKKKEYKQKPSKTLIQQDRPYSGLNRRAINLFPLPIDDDDHEFAQTQSLKFHQLLVNIEGKQRTCCLKVIAPKRKARAALLVLRGRVVGCLYGRRDLSWQSVDKDAQRQALIDLAMPGNLLDAYPLPENLVLAAASLFHGHILPEPETNTPEKMLVAAINQISSYALPGCLVVSNQATEETIFQIYMANEKIIGIHANEKGWLNPSMPNALKCLQDVTLASIKASILPTRNADDIALIGLSLTGLGDRQYNLASPSILNKQSQAQQTPYQISNQNPINQVPGKHSSKRRIHGLSKVRHAHSITP